jgi:hypothetical protein
MEYLKQFEMNKIGLFNKHVKLPKKVYTCKWYIQENTFDLEFFKTIFMFDIYIINKYLIFNVNKMMLNKGIGCFQHLFVKDMFQSCH